MQADFHIHTTASDGCFTPLQILEQAVIAGLTNIAITDHDTIDGCLSMQAYVPANLNVISGIEINTNHLQTEVHILGYGFDLGNVTLKCQLRELAQRRLLRVKRIIEKITALGYNINMKDVLAVASSASVVGRPHVAQALIVKGYFANVSSVFETLLAHGRPGYEPYHKLTPQDAISLIRNSGGLAILAHPGLIGNDDLVREIIPLGLDGLEVYYPQHTETMVNNYCDLAKQYNLLVTGGSDFHGFPERYPQRLGQFICPSIVASKFLSVLQSA